MVVLNAVKQKEGWSKMPGGKMPMKNGMPAFVGDGKGKMAKGGMTPKTKGYYKGGKVMKPKGMARGGMTRGCGAATKGTKHSNKMG